VLNACEGARAPADPTRPTFAGVATCLVDEGVPAVVAMQFPISDRAASAFGLGLHRALADGEDVARAVVAGRQAIRDDIPGTLQWITPALFLRQPPVMETAAREAAPALPAITTRVREVEAPEVTVAGAACRDGVGSPGVPQADFVTEIERVKATGSALITGLLVEGRDG
jgi:hypothetical protein